MLHGEIKANNEVVGQWTALRKERLWGNEEDGDLTCRYDCMAAMGNDATFFSLKHTYADGATVLASRILAQWHPADTGDPPRKLQYDPPSPQKGGQR